MKPTTHTHSTTQRERRKTFVFSRWRECRSLLLSRARYRRERWHAKTMGTVQSIIPVALVGDAPKRPSVPPSSSSVASNSQVLSGTDGICAILQAALSCLESETSTDQRSPSPSPPRRQTPYQEDFMISHVQRVGKSMSPQKPQIWQGKKSSFGADSLTLSNDKLFQSRISNESLRAGHEVAHESAAPALPPESHLARDVFDLPQLPAIVAGFTPPPPPPRPMLAPVSTVDSWMLVQQKKMAGLIREYKPGFRNPYTLAGNLGAPHTKIDGFVTKAAKDHKKVTMGALNKPWVGIPRNPKASQMQDVDKLHNIGVRDFLRPDDRKQFQGVMPHTTKDDYLIGHYRDVREAQREQSKMDVLPRPQMTSDDYWIAHSKHLTATGSTSPQKRTRWPFTTRPMSSRSLLSARSHNDRASSSSSGEPPSPIPYDGSDVDSVPSSRDHGMMHSSEVA